jgi:hypothetical protein
MNTVMADWITKISNEEGLNLAKRRLIFRWILDRG